LKSVVVVESTREDGGKIDRETRLYITSLGLLAHQRLKLTFLRRFRPFEDGTPAHDHLGDILAALAPEPFARCFVPWAAAQTRVPA